MRKVIDLIENSDFTFSVEVTPAIKQDEIDKVNLEAVFFAVTWHAKSYDFGNLNIPPVKLAIDLRNKGKNVLMHLTCDQLKTDFLDKLLEKLKDIGVCNLLVMLGDDYEAGSSDFQNSKELIKYIRNNTGEYFCIGVAGFPDYGDEKIKQLQEKVAQGADFVLTQAFFEYDVYKKFATKCQKLGITVPIIPGVFVYDTFEQFVGFMNVCKIKVSDSFSNYIMNNKQVSGREIVGKVAKELKNEKCSSNHVHLFTFNNLENAGKFCLEYLINE